MSAMDLAIEKSHIDRLVASSNADAALLYLYLKSGRPEQSAAEQLKLSKTRVDLAMAMLRQLGLWQQTPVHTISGERPSYSEVDVLQAMDYDNDFKHLYAEVQRLLGRTLNTEELKILLGFVRYLGLPGDVICVMICYCKERARKRGSLRNPSLRTIEKEAYYWAEQGIDTMERAAAFMQAQNVRASRIGKLLQIMQIRGRNLTAGEERFAASWLEMGFDDDALALAYERTCLNTGGLNWAYMNRILTRWHEAGLHTLEKIRKGDKKPEHKGAVGQLGKAELDAIRTVLQEE